MPPVGFEHTISAGERPQTYALDRAATGTGKFYTHYAFSHSQHRLHMSAVVSMGLTGQEEKCATELVRTLWQRENTLPLLVIELRSPNSRPVSLIVTTTADKMEIWKTLKEREGY